jgi:ABC-type uncharacterized transport system permease subunit
MSSLYSHIPVQIKVILKAKIIETINVISTMLVLSIGIIYCVHLVSNIDMSSLLIEFFRPFIRAYSSDKDISDLLSILIKSAPLILTAFAFLIPFKAGFFYIGAEGVMIVASLFYLLTYRVTNTMISIGYVSFIIPLVISVVFGIFWGYLPLYLKNRTSTNEVITGMFMNSIALISIGYFLKLTNLLDQTVNGTLSISLYDKLKI